MPSTPKQLKSSLVIVLTDIFDITILSQESLHVLFRGVLVSALNVAPVPGLSGGLSILGHNLKSN